MQFKTVLYLLLISLITTFSCKEDEGYQPDMIMRMMVEEPRESSDGKIILAAKIVQYNPEMVSEYGFYIGNQKMVSSGISNDGEFELIVDGLDKLTTYSYYPYFEYSDTKIRKKHTPSSFMTGFPIIDSYSDTVVTDFSTITITGSELNHEVFFYLVTKSSPSSEDVTLKLKTKSVTGNEIQVSLPAMGSRDNGFPPFYEGAIQPCALYIGSGDMTKMKKIGDLDYRYRFHLASKSGPLDGTFSVVVWTGRTVPPVEEIKVYFDGTKRILLDKEETFDFTNDGFISAYRLEYSIPFGYESGSINKITVFSPFDEEFISIKGDELFTVD